MSQTSSGHPPEDFDWILVQYNNDDIEPIIVAGQAVNTWGKTFREWDAKHNPILKVIKRFNRVIETKDAKKVAKEYGSPQTSQCDLW